MSNSKRSRGVRRIGGVHGAAGQTPQQPAVDRPERQIGPGFYTSLVRTARPAWWPRSRGRGPVRSGPGSDPDDPAASSAAHCRAPRRSCQTMARCRGSPVRRSHSTTVSRWLVMPIAATGWSSVARSSRQGGGHGRPDLFRVVLHPTGTREVLRELPVAGARSGRRPPPTAMARTPVVPASRAITTRHAHRP